MLVYDWFVIRNKRSICSKYMFSELKIVLLCYLFIPSFQRKKRKVLQASGPDDQKQRQNSALLHGLKMASLGKKVFIHGDIKKSVSSLQRNA